MPETSVAFFAPLIITLAVVLCVTGATVQLAGKRYPLIGLTGAAVQLAGAFAAMFVWGQLHERAEIVTTVVIAVLALRGVLHFGAQVRGSCPWQAAGESGKQS